jgi:RsiW-degrading membrane proteinase PrsW (M82 family)
VADALVLATLLVLVSFVPPLLLAVRVRNAERSRREPWRALLKAFLWGAVGAALVAILVEEWLAGVLGLDPAIVGSATLLGVLVAPVVEESAKALGLLAIRDEDPQPEDGLVYGAVAGLGFAATENLFYVGAAFLLGGADVAVATALYRGVATVALHAAATALSGYGIWASRFHTVQGSWLGGLLAAVALHAAYNAIAGIDALWATVLALVVALFAFSRLLRRVRALDRASPAAWRPR